jgi:hypothetical protein
MGLPERTARFTPVDAAIKGLLLRCRKPLIAPCYYGMDGEWFPFRSLAISLPRYPMARCTGPRGVR